MMFVIAGGMGGHAAGEIASAMACREAAAAYRAGDTEDLSETDEGTLQRLERSLWTAHRQVLAAAREQSGLSGMGTTLSALVLARDKAFIAHIGDSRIYLCRDGHCRQLTVDHTKIQHLIDTGRLAPGQENGFYSHILTQAVGGYGDLDDVFTRVQEVQRGDRFLLCTDGLHGQVGDAVIRDILSEDSAPETACDRLVQAAIAQGGHDNVTVIVIQL